jgi:hypothetical protein
MGRGWLLAAAASLVACAGGDASPLTTSADECASCHEAEFVRARDHVGKRPNTCATCHSQKSWRPATDAISGASRHEEMVPLPTPPDASTEPPAQPGGAGAPVDADASAGTGTRPKPRKKSPPPPPPDAGAVDIHTGPSRRIHGG